MSNATFSSLASISSGCTDAMVHGYRCWMELLLVILKASTVVFCDVLVLCHHMAAASVDSYSPGCEKT